MSKVSQDPGATLPELLITTFVLAIGVLATLGVNSTAIHTLDSSKKAGTASLIAVQLMDEILTDPDFGRLQANFNDGPNVRRPVPDSPDFTSRLKVSIKPGTGGDLKIVSVTVFYWDGRRERDVTFVQIRKRP
ncbi:MAG: hypothetical protein HYU64_11545 [Armatimonadetes bacterium]|nr:hypothetical protein [Armatimonadota bacterium]